ncbi:MAG: amino acid ABC transporter permease [Anaerolineae bacterium]|jgi:polar amino acid transport system permease protein
MLGRWLRRISGDWRRSLIALGGVLVLVGYLLPMFPGRIASAVTRFSDGSELVNAFPVLISEQHFAQAKSPAGADLLGVEVVTEPVSGLAASGYGWLTAVLGSNDLRRHASFVLCLGLPALAALVLLVAVGAARNLASPLSGWVPAAAQVGALSLLGICLAWAHQSDFSNDLLAAGAGALAPGVGFWVALAGSAAILVGAVLLRGTTHKQLTTWWALVLAVGMTAWLLTRVRPYPFLEIWRFVSDGILVTLRIVATSFGLILLVGLVGGLGRISRNPIIYGLSSLYVELIRGIPLLVQLLFIWYALPQVFDMLGELLLRISPSLEQQGQALIDLRLNPFTAAVLGLTICYGAYGSEIFRAGISSIHSGQMEAARSLGMSYVQAMRHIVLPQAVRVILPPVGNEFVALLKDSSLVSVLAVSDLTRRGREYMARTFLSFDTWIMVALCYLVLTLFSSRVVEYIESKTAFE